MKFSVLDPTEENIRETLLNDQLGRNEELRQFVRLLNSIDGNCTIALDGDWGSGKTFFVKQAQMIIDSFNEYKNKKAISVEESGFENMRQFLGCKETIGSLSATSSEEFLCQDGRTRILLKEDREIS